jgi:hypothetical protein
MMKDDFSVLDVKPTGAPQATHGNSAKKEKIGTLEKSYMEELNQNPEIKSVENSLREAIVIEKALSFSDTGGFKQEKKVPEIGPDGQPVLDAKGKPKMERKLVETPEVVGYVIKNVGNVDIPYQTEVYRQEGEIWVGEKVERVLKPGQSAALTKKYLAKLSLEPQFNLKFSNGIVIVKVAGNETDDIETILAKSHFRPANFSVTNDMYNINISKHVSVPGKPGEKKWVVKKDFLETFGYLNNPEPEKVKKKRIPKEKVDSQALVAAYVRNLARKRGEI